MFFEKTRNLISNIFEKIGYLLILSISFLVFLQVVLRKVFNSPLIWPEELIRIFLIWVTFVGSYVAIKHKSHLTLSFLINKLNTANKRRVEIFIHFFVLIFLTIIIIYGISFINLVGAIPMPVTGIQKSTIYGVMWLCILLMFIENILQLLDKIFKRN